MPASSSHRPPSSRWTPTALRRLLIVVVSAVIALLAVNACGSSASKASGPSGSIGAATASTSTTGSASSSAQPMIHIKSFKYIVPASVVPGATVQVMNMDDETHTVTADGAGGFDVLAQVGSIATLTAPSQPGSYPFHCKFHAEMHGVLVVK